MMRPIAQHPAARAHHAVHTAGDANAEPLHGADQARGIVSLEQEMDVVAEQRELYDPRSESV
jgi:hypothetical protein